MKKLNHLDINLFGLANRIISTCARCKICDITNMKVQKLLYYVYAAYYKQYDALLFDCKKIMFSTHGPVVPVVYDSLKHFQSNTITSFIVDIDLSVSCSKFCIADIREHECFAKISEIINLIIHRIGYKEDSVLLNISHAKYGVWYKMASKSPINSVYQIMTKKYVTLMKKEIVSILSHSHYD